ncbi:hypothetical protein [Halobacillus litoralis]|nr:hypothetical protein [Halobacillus litoralis]
MNTTISTFMKIALVAITISSLVFGVLLNKVNETNTDVHTYIESH